MFSKNEALIQLCDRHKSRIAELEAALTRVRLERDEAVALMRAVADMTLSHSSIHYAREDIRAFLARLDKQQENANAN